MPVLMRAGGGGKKIKDATAMPSDVASGKVFYNNDGRQVGTNQFQVKIYTIPAQTVDSNQFEISGKNGLLKYSLGSFTPSGSYYNSSGTVRFNYKKVFTIGYKSIVGISYNGTFYPFAYTNAPSLVALNEIGGCKFYFCDGYVYVGGDGYFLNIPELTIYYTN